MKDSKGKFISTHGESHSTKLYRVWCGMKERCSNPHNKSYKNYGGKNITVCEEWEKSYEAFREWAYANGYKQGLTIDRINTEKGYCPDNCRWVDTATQNRNYSRNHNITYNGKTQCLADWADELGINRGTVLFRLKQGLSLDEVFYIGDRRKSRWKK